MAYGHGTAGVMANRKAVIRIKPPIAASANRKSSVNSLRVDFFTMIPLSLCDLPTLRELSLSIGVIRHCFVFPFWPQQKTKDFFAKSHAEKGRRRNMSNGLCSWSDGAQKGKRAEGAEQQGSKGAEEEKKMLSCFLLLFLPEPYYSFRRWAEEASRRRDSLKFVKKKVCNPVHFSLQPRGQWQWVRVEAVWLSF